MEQLERLKSLVQRQAALNEIGQIETARRDLTLAGRKVPSYALVGSTGLGITGRQCIGSACAVDSAHCPDYYDPYISKPICFRGALAPSLAGTGGEGMSLFARFAGVGAWSVFANFHWLMRMLANFLILLTLTAGSEPITASFHQRPLDQVVSELGLPALTYGKNLIDLELRQATRQQALRELLRVTGGRLAACQLFVCLLNPGISMLEDTNWNPELLAARALMLDYVTLQWRRDEQLILFCDGERAGYYWMHGWGGCGACYHSEGGNWIALDEYRAMLDEISSRCTDTSIEDAVVAIRVQGRGCVSPPASIVRRIAACLLPDDRARLRELTDKDG